MMSVFNLKTKTISFFCFFISVINIGCRKLIEIGPPINTITTAEVFGSDALATSAMNGIYTIMANGSLSSGVTPNLSLGFSTGLSTALGSLSSDDLSVNANAGIFYLFNTNRISAINSSSSYTVWKTAYKTIYGVNSVIEGIAASTAPRLHDSVRTELTGEAKFVRAFSYFYLTNFFGDVPMVLTVDFNKTQNLPRMPQQDIYRQIIKDLKEAQAVLSADYSVGHGERIIPNKWAATLLLARAYLYSGDYANAAAQATSLINNTALFRLESDLNNVFLTGSQEAIWQLKQTTDNGNLKNATIEGYSFLPRGNAFVTYNITNQLLSAFETGDKRKTAWIGTSIIGLPGVAYYPYKYKTGADNGNAGEPSTEYYMVLRLAEAYLIRAEAEANGAVGGLQAAIADLKSIRERAGLTGLSDNLNQQQVKTAVAKERQVEFFAEWGHRWFDLKRTGQAHSVLSVIPLKQPWAGDYQLLYPIPQEEIKSDHFLIQNQGY